MTLEKELYDKAVKPAEFKGVSQDVLAPLTSQDFNLCYGESFSVWNLQAYSVLFHFVGGLVFVFFTFLSCITPHLT